MQKSLGFTNQDIRWQYITRSLVVMVGGVLTGTVLANTLGELVGVGLISSFGASFFHFDINPFFAYGFSPLLITTCVIIPTVLGIWDIRKLSICTYMKE